MARLQPREHPRPNRCAPPPKSPTPRNLQRTCPRRPQPGMTTYTPRPRPKNQGGGVPDGGAVAERAPAPSAPAGQRHARPEHQGRGAAAIALSSRLPAPGPSSAGPRALGAWLPPNSP